MEALKWFIIFGLGTLFGIFISWADELGSVQKGYTMGRESVLNSVVVVGDEDSPCAVKITLSALEAMVNTGILDWHKACNESFSGQED